MPLQEIETFSIIIPSSLNQLPEVEKLSEEVSKKMGLDEEDMDNIAIAVTEAVNNAIKHGNREDESKKVTIEFVVSSSEITVKIKDEGGGFDPTKLSNPLEPENLLKESGRGIFILKALMDKVDFKFSETGSEIILVKNI